MLYDLEIAVAPLWASASSFIKWEAELLLTKVFLSCNALGLWLLTSLGVFDLFENQGKSMDPSPENNHMHIYKISCIAAEGSRAPALGSSSCSSLDHTTSLA